MTGPAATGHGHVQPYESQVVLPGEDGSIGVEADPKTRVRTLRRTTRQRERTRERQKRIRTGKI